MSESGATWPLERHTRAKHDILREYLKAWFPIMASQSQVVYMDGFAGPGTYSKGEDGSPVIAIRTAREHILKNRFKQIVFWFIEKNPQTYRRLKQVLAEKFPDLKNKPGDTILYTVVNAQFSDHVKEKLDELKSSQQKLAPTFALLDPFGFSGLPMSLINTILKHERCEVLITFMAGFVTRFHDELRENALNELYGTNEWKKAKAEPTPERRRQFYLDLYVRQLKTKGGANFVTTFEMIGKDNKTIYYLVYGTKHLKGTEVVKRAMQKVSQGNTYRFSDRTDPKQTFLFNESDDSTASLGELIFQNFKGKTVHQQQLENFVAEKPYIFKKNVLKYLEQTNRIIDVNPRKRKLTYPDNCRIKFAMGP